MQPSDHGNMQCAESQRSYMYILPEICPKIHQSHGALQTSEELQTQESLERILCKYSNCPKYRKPPKAWSRSWFQPPLDQTSLDHITYPVCWISQKIETAFALVLSSGLHLSCLETSPKVSFATSWFADMCPELVLWPNFGFYKKTPICVLHTARVLHDVQWDPQTPFLIQKSPSLPLHLWVDSLLGKPSYSLPWQPLQQQLLALVVKLPTSKRTMGTGALISKINAEKSRFKKYLCLYETEALLLSGALCLVEKNHHVSRCLGINYSRTIIYSHFQ